MTAKDLLNEYRANHPPSEYRISYWVEEGATCDDCGAVLTDDERWRNVTENEECDGNMVLCDRCYPLDADEWDDDDTDD